MVAAEHYEAPFRKLTLEEQARADDFARSKGFRLTCLSPKVEGFPVIPIEVVPAEEITSENYPQFDEQTAESLRSYYSDPVESKSKTYPPVGFTPGVSKNEKTAAALLSYMVSDQDGTGIEDWGYPLERLPRDPEAVIEPEPSSRLSLIREFFSLFRR